MAMEVYRFSGDVLTVLPMNLKEKKTAKAVKQTSAAKVGISRFKQRFLLEESSREILDEDFCFSSVEGPAGGLGILAT